MGSQTTTQTTPPTGASATTGTPATSEVGTAFAALIVAWNKLCPVKGCDTDTSQQTRSPPRAAVEACVKWRPSGFGGRLDVRTAGSEYVSVNGKFRAQRAFPSLDCTWTTSSGHNAVLHLAPSSAGNTGDYFGRCPTPQVDPSCRIASPGVVEQPLLATDQGSHVIGTWIVGARSLVVAASVTLPLGRRSGVRQTTSLLEAAALRGLGFLVPKS